MRAEEYAIEETASDIEEDTMKNEEITAAKKFPASRPARKRWHVVQSVQNSAMV